MGWVRPSRSCAEVKPARLAPFEQLSGAGEPTEQPLSGTSAPDAVACGPLDVPHAGDGASLDEVPVLPVPEALARRSWGLAFVLGLRQLIGHRSH